MFSLQFFKTYFKNVSYYFIFCQLLLRVPENCKIANFPYFESHNFLCVLRCIVCFQNVCLVVFKKSFILFQQKEIWVTHKHSFGYYHNWLHVQLTSLSVSRFWCPRSWLNQIIRPNPFPEYFTFSALLFIPLMRMARQISWNHCCLNSTANF